MLYGCLDRHLAFPIRHTAVWNSGHRRIQVVCPGFVRDITDTGKSLRGCRAALFHTPRQALREVGLEVRPPAADGRPRVELVAGGQVAVPAVGLTLVLAAPAGLGRIVGIVAAPRQEEEPGGRVALLQAGVPEALATSASISNSFAYTIRRTSDC
jgi:hypothetical protein